MKVYVVPIGIALKKKSELKYAEFVVEAKCKKKAVEKAINFAKTAGDIYFDFNDIGPIRML